MKGLGPYRPSPLSTFGVLLVFKAWLLGLALQCQEAVARIFVNGAVVRQVATCVIPLVLRKVINSLNLAAAKCDLLGVQVVCNTFTVSMLVCHFFNIPLSVRLVMVHLTYPVVFSLVNPANKLFAPPLTLR